VTEQSTAPAGFPAMTPHEHRGRCPVQHVSLQLGGSRAPLSGYELFDRLRDDAPVHWVDEGVGYHLLTRQEDILAVAQDPGLFSSRYFNPALGGEPPFTLVPVNLDPPDHTKWRRLLAPVFAPGAVAAWDDRIRARARELVTTLQPRGGCDAVKDFALRLPTSVFLSLMGLPQEELDRFLLWETAILHPGPDGTFEGLSPLDAQDAVSRYFTDLVAQRRSGAATGSDGTDLVSLAMTWQIDGEPISDEDLMSFYLLMFEAGLDTVTAELGYGMYHLATHPEHRARIVADPAAIPNAVEELLRVYPIVNPPRVLTRDAEINGCPVEAGEYVVMGLSAAGRDERVFEDAREVDLDRARIPHLTFGGGPHRCLGSHLARHELAIAYETWHEAIPEYRVDESAEFDEAVSGLWGLNALPLVWDLPAGAR
jgi:cytochrome P450